MAEIVQVDRQQGKVERHRQFDKRDWKYLATFLVDEFQRRKDTDDRKEKERHWKEIDRQIAMQPQVEFKRLPDGKVDDKKAWMAEMELPLQAQALEVLTADARRMQFPDSGPWFRSHSQTTDKYLEKANFKGIILGDEMQVPSEINQDNADKLVEGFLTHCFRQYDHVSRFDMINAEAFKYGMGVARGRKETKQVFIHEASGTRKDTQKIPVIVPVSIKNTYLDDSKPSMHSSHVLGPAHIAHEFMKYENLAIAARKGKNNPDDEDGGWMPEALSMVIPDKNGYVQVLEMEGDIIVPRRTVRSVVIPNCIITVAIGGVEKGDNKASRAVVRFRFRKHPYSSYLLFPYHYEGADQIYPTSPLMKGRPVQMMCSDALNRLLDSAMLKNAPPVGYDSSNTQFATNGGPSIHPFAQWDTNDPASIKVFTEIGGDPSALSSILMQGINLYAQLTGVLPARLGAQTISHTTAYAKGAELQQGAVRTVDYVNASGHGPITRWLSMAYSLGRESLKPNDDISFFIDAYGGFVEIGKDMLPEHVSFEWFGSGGPQEAQQKASNKLNALQLALKVDQLGMQMGKPPRVDLDRAIDEILREGGWSDIAAIINGRSSVGGASPASPLQGPGAGNPGAAVAAIQNLTGAGG